MRYFIVIHRIMHYNIRVPREIRMANLKVKLNSAIKIAKTLSRNEEELRLATHKGTIGRLEKAIEKRESRLEEIEAEVCEALGVEGITSDMKNELVEKYNINEENSEWLWRIGNGDWC